MNDRDMVRSNRRWVLALVLAALVLMCICGALATSSNRRQNAATGNVTGVTRAQPAQPVAEQTKPTATALAGVGDLLRQDVVTWKVLGAERLGSEFYGDRPDGEPLTTPGGWVRVLVEVGNVGAEPFTIPDIALADSAGREFARNGDAIWRIPSGRLCSLERLNPGLTRQCEYVFDVPADAAGLLAVVSEPGAFGRSAVIDLGLP